MQSSSQIVTTNKPTPSFFYRPDGLPVTHKQCQSTEGKELHSMDLITPKLILGPST